MHHTSSLLSDSAYLNFHLRDLEFSRSLGEPVVAQLAGDDPDALVQAARKLVGYVDAIDLNLGCPQKRAMDGHYGGYLLGKKDWPLVSSLVSALSHSLPLPVHSKIRLPSLSSDVVPLSLLLAQSGSSCITLHARHVAERRRRAGPAKLNWVGEVSRALREEGWGEDRVRVISNGNVRCWEDIGRNLEETGAAGVMVGEALLGNPALFSGFTHPPLRLASEYLDLCATYSGTATLPTIKQHVRSFVESDLSCIQSFRSKHFKSFLASLERCEDAGAVERLVAHEELVRAWGGTDS